MSSALHFVGFVHPDQGKDPAYQRACAVFGTPDFIHRRWDRRARDEAVPGDVVVYSAKVDCSEPPSENAFDDSAVM